MKQDRMVRMSRLLDFYGSLLTEKQQSVLKLYHNRDNSLAEIAEQSGTTRQAICDMIEKGENQLEKYEKALKLLEKYEKTYQKLQKCQKLLETNQNNDAVKNEITNLIEEL